MIKKEVHCSSVYEDEKVLAFRDINPQAPMHVIIVPKVHIDKASDLTKETAGAVSDMVLAAAMIAKDLKIDKLGYRIVLNCEEYGGQTIYHIHIHLLGGRRMTWPPG